jgi:hypothetical protein
MTNQKDVIELSSVETLKSMVEVGFDKGVFLKDFKKFIHSLPKSELEDFMVEVLTANIKKD